MAEDRDALVEHDRSTHEAQHTGWIRRWRSERGL
jgi:hypothetical protein